jgi:hypothetical protein
LTTSFMKLKQRATLIMRNTTLVIGKMYAISWRGRSDNEKTLSYYYP